MKNDFNDYHPTMEIDEDFERFELLSAYMDNEVTEDERQQVEQWLAEDTAFAAKYQQLQSLNQSWQTIPTPLPSISTNELANRVFQTIDKRRQKRFKVITIGAIAASVTAAVSGINGLLNNNLTPQIATQSTPIESPTNNVVPQPVVTPLMVSLNDPIIKIRKPAKNRQLRSDLPDGRIEG